MAQESKRKNKYKIAEEKRKQKIKKITWSSILAGLLVLTLALYFFVNWNPIVKMEIEGYGTVEIELYPDEAPNTVRNFIHLAKSGFYDGLTFHRVAEDFCIQGGCPDGDGTGDPGYSIKGEFSANGFTKNTIKHEAGVISMARGTTGYDTAGSQFFICPTTSSEVSDSLDGKYAAFGKVISGFDIIQQINEVPVSGSSGDGQPLIDIVIKSITVNTKLLVYKKPEVIK